MKGCSNRRFLALPVLLLWAQPGIAQQQVASAGSADDLQEIIVTAQRREQNSLAVPLSVQAYTADQLSNNGVQNLTDLQFTTPGYLPTTGEGYTQIYIRGIGNNIFVGADPSVATFVDDVPRIYGSLNQNFLDVTRVEVLKGAQGGLYGRNATGGVVNIVTVQPKTTGFSGDTLVDYGEKGTFRAAAWANVPISDNVAFLVSMERDSHGPYVRNLASSSPYTAAMFPTGSTVGTPEQTANLLNSLVHAPAGLQTQDFWATDDKLLLKLADTFKITIAGDYSAKVDNDGSANVDATPAYLQAFLSNGLLAPFGFNPHLPLGFERGADGKYTTAVGDPNFVDTWDYGGSVTAVWNAPGVDLTSISAYRGQSTGYLAGSTAGTVPDASFDVYTHRDFVYEEIRAASTYASALSWLGGATYLTNRVDDHTGAYLLGGLATTDDIQSTDTVRNWSAYAQGTYDLTSVLSLTLSGRYVHETNHADYTEPTVATAETGESKFLPSATLSYKLDDGNLYARWARGVKSGGVNPTVAPTYFPAGSPGDVFAPEQVDTYEVGYRQALFDHKVQLTTAVFYNDYKDIQIGAHATPAYATNVILAIVNGGSARTYGAEESLEWRLATPVTVGLSAGYLNAKYKNFALENNAVLASFDLSGQTMLNSPTWQGSFTANLEQPLNDKLSLVGNVLESYIGTVIYQQSNIPGVLPDVTGPAYWLTNVRFGVQTRDGKYGFSVFARNLFNRAYYTYGNSASTGNIFLWGDPRVVGGELTARF